MRTRIKIPVNKPYDFQSTIQAHGWVDLLPNFPDEKTRSFSRAELLPSGQVVLIHVSGNSELLISEVVVAVEHADRLSRADEKEIRARVRMMLRIDEDLDGFYLRCKSIGGKWRQFPPGQGFLLRSPQIFEDLVKVICTTNIQWGGTKRMVKELVEAFGKPFPERPETNTFPSPEMIASCSIEAFNEKVRLGYRASYVHDLAIGIAEGDIDLGAFTGVELATSEVKSRLLSIKGVGNYAAASILMLLGRYDQIPVDTVFREYMRATHFEGTAFAEPEALKIYDEWGEWKYLAYWFEMMNFYRNK